MHMSQDHRQSLLLKPLLNTFGTCCKTHTIATRYESNDIEDVPATQISAALDLAPLKHPMPDRDNESSDEYCEKWTLATPWLNY